MPLLTRKRVMQVAVESANGTEAGRTALYLTSGIDFYAEDIEIYPTGEFVRRPGSGTRIGNENKGVIEGRPGKCTFKTELKGTGAAALDTALAALFGASGLLAVAQVYTVFSNPASHVTVTLDVFEDGKVKTLYGAAADWTLETTAGKRVLIAFEFEGIWKAPTDLAMPAFAPNTNPPVKFQGATVLLGGSARKIDKLNISPQNAVTPRKDGAAVGGVSNWMITDNDPQINVDPEAELVAGYDVNGIWLAETEQVFSVALTDGTDTFTIACPAVQFKEVPEGDRDGIQIYDISGQCNHSHATNDDALSLTVAA